MTTADDVVVGAGVVGASVAYHLAARGRRVVVVDRAQEPGAGSTGRATGGFRTQFGSTVNVRLSMLARAKLETFEAETGVDPGVHACGYLFLASTVEQLDALRSALEVQRAAGFDGAVEIDRDDAARLNPAACLDGVVGGTYGALDAFIRPLDIMRGYTVAAERLGVRFVRGAGPASFEVRSGRIVAVRVGDETHASESVVNAAGAWAGVVAREAGADLPVTPSRRQVAVTEPFDGLPASMPMTIWLDDGFHLRVRDGRVLLLLPAEHASEDPFDTGFDEAWRHRVVERAKACMPCLAGAAIDPPQCWSGLYEMSPDKHAILGRAPELENFYYANGSSGHGVMHAPALGQLLAELIVDGEAHSVDVHALRPTRFLEGAPNPSSHLL